MTKRKSKFGRIYKKWNKRPDGTRVEHSTWTVRYKGKDYATGETDPRAAERFLLKLAGDLAREGKTPKEEKRVILMDELFDDLVGSWRRKANRSLHVYEGGVNLHLRPYFGNLEACTVGSRRINDYIEMRQKQKAALATIDQELAWLRRAFRLAHWHEPCKLDRVPKIDFFQAYKTNARMGFMKPAEYQALRMALPPHLKLIFITAYHCGGRLGELTQARIEDVDFERQRLFLRPEVTKTEEGRYLPIYGDMVEAFKRTIAQIQRDYPGCPWLFPNEHGTDRVKTFYKAWAAALKRAGLPENILFHDLRRTAVRNMIRAGVPRKLAMSISGHKTEDVFERYHIIDETDFEDARQKMEQFHRGAS